MNQNDSPSELANELTAKLKSEIAAIEAKRESLKAKYKHLLAERAKIEAAEQELLTEDANLQAQYLQIKERLLEARNE